MAGNSKRSLLDELFEYCDEGYKVCLVFLLFEKVDLALEELLNVRHHEDELIEPLRNWADRQQDIDEFECRLLEAYEMCKVCNDVRKNRCQKYFEVPDRLCSFLEKSSHVHPMRKLLLYTCKADRYADDFVSKARNILREKVHNKVNDKLRYKLHDKLRDECHSSSIAEIIILGLILENELCLGTWEAVTWEHEEACNLAFIDEQFQNNEFINIFHKIHSLQDIINGRLSQFPIYYEQNVGIFLIIDNENFKKNDQRKGTKRDVENLKKCWEEYGFVRDNMIVKEDCNANQIIDELKDCVMKKMKKKHSMFMFCVLSHGADNDIIEGYDGETVKTSDIIKVLLNEKRLCNKPKILILQACRGSKKVVETSTDDSQQNLSWEEKLRETVNTENNILILYPTLEEYAALRDKNIGTLYIHNLCKVFKDSGLSPIDFQTTLLKVNHKVSEFEDCIQVCSFKGHFNKKLVLKKIINESNSTNKYSK